MIKNCHFLTPPTHLFDNVILEWSLGQFRISPLIHRFVGSGKSTFINKFRGLTARDKFKTNSVGKKLYAPVGLKETTFEIHQYEFEENPLIQLYDLPGAGTENFPIETYSEKIQMDQYDAFVLLTKDRFLENDKKISEEIMKRGKPYFFAR